MTWPKPSRRCGWPRRFGDMQMTDTIFITGVVIHAHHGVMQHEAKVGQSFMHRSRTARPTCRRPRAPTSSPTPSATPGGRRRERGLHAPSLPAGGGRRRRRRRGRAGRFPAGRSPIHVTIHKPHAPIAATFDDVGVVLDPQRQATVDMAEALIALGGNVGDSPGDARPRHRRFCATARCPRFWRVPPTTAPRPGASTDQPPFINCAASS